MNTNKLEYAKEIDTFMHIKQHYVVVNSVYGFDVYFPYIGSIIRNYKYILHNKDIIAALYEKESIKDLDLSNLCSIPYVYGRLENEYLFDLHKGLINTSGKSKNYCHLARITVGDIYNSSLVFDVNYCLEGKTCIVCTDSYSLEKGTKCVPDVYKLDSHGEALCILKDFGFDVERKDMVGGCLELTHETLYMTAKNEELIYVRDNLERCVFYNNGKATVNMIVSSDTIKSLCIIYDVCLRLNIMINREKHSKIVADLIYRECIKVMLDSFKILLKGDFNDISHIMQIFKYTKRLESWYIDKDYDKLISSCNDGTILINYRTLSNYVRTNSSSESSKCTSILKAHGGLILKIQYYG